MFVWGYDGSLCEDSFMCGSFFYRLHAKVAHLFDFHILTPDDAHLSVAKNPRNRCKSLITSSEIFLGL
jgi:hypothetical protein